MTLASQLDGDSPRVIVQLLEGGAASVATSPDAARARLHSAGQALSISDVCLGWGLPLALVETVAAESEALGARLWLWHPLLSGDGRYVPGPHRVLGLDGRPAGAPGGLGEFTFDCPVQAGAREAALARLDEAASRYPWHGVFLDKVRWPSPTSDPARELTCFCGACLVESAREGLDLAVVADHLVEAAGSPDGRIRLVRSLFRTGLVDGLDQLLAWRCQRITATVVAAAGRIASHRGRDGQPMRVSLDVFAPTLAPLVGQDIRALAPLGEFTKAMLYLGTHGPAGLSFELSRLASWLASGGVPAPVALLSELSGLPLPTDEGLLREGSLDVEVFERQLSELLRCAGTSAAAGIDAVAIEGLAELPDAALEAAVGLAQDASVPIVLSWDLMAVSDDRLKRVAARLAGAA